MGGMMQAGPGAHLAFLDLARRARHAADAAELGFIVVNDTLLLSPYRQAALWFEIGGVRALSGVVRPEANAPYVHWLEKVSATLTSRDVATQITADDLPGAEAEAWDEWLPAYALWLPLAAAEARTGRPATGRGGVLLARDTPWRAEEIALLSEWVDLWRHAWQSSVGTHPWSWQRGGAGATRLFCAAQRGGLVAATALALVVGGRPCSSVSGPSLGPGARRVGAGQPGNDTGAA